MGALAIVNSIHFIYNNRCSTKCYSSRTIIHVYTIYRFPRSPREFLLQFLLLLNMILSNAAKFDYHTERPSITPMLCRCTIVYFSLLFFTSSLMVFEEKRRGLSCCIVGKRQIGTDMISCVYKIHCTSVAMSYICFPSPTVAQFKARLKTHLFKIAFDS